MVELSGRCGKWHPWSWNYQVEVGSCPRMLELSVRVGSDPREDVTVR